ncbi:hypothetical protein [Puia dinghuensis]|uniref:hypothetical protein n=1 Tax=Puia dinghuensis TaxID=1792502 RepID=UPI001668D0C1|nr:hypothetical protein [Puia dinghuensis]
MKQTKIKVIYHTRQEYSHYKYPKLCIHGRWFEQWGFQWRDEVFIAPRSKTGLVVVNARINATNVLPILANTRIKRLSTTLFGYAALLLQGRWFWFFGFYPGDHVEISNPASGIIHIQIIRSGADIEAEQDELKRLGIAEWKLFKELLSTKRA